MKKTKITTSRGYERIREKVAQTLDSNLPSVYMLNKSLPLKAVSCIFNVEAKEKDEIKNDIIYGKKNTRCEI